MTERKFKDLKPGEKFKYGNTEFVALGEEQGGILAVAVEPLTDMAFDLNDENDWKKSTLRQYLNGKYLEQIDMSALIEYESDLTANDGMTDYGTCWDLIFLLSGDLYRKYRYLLPKWETCAWLITPYSCLEKYRCTTCAIYTDGAFGTDIADCASNVFVACLFNPESPLKREQLRPCPFCGANRPIFVNYSEAYAVRCRKCEAETRFYETREKAKNAWNIRK